MVKGPWNIRQRRPPFRPTLPLIVTHLVELKNHNDHNRRIGSTGLRHEKRVEEDNIVRGEWQDLNRDHDLLRLGLGRAPV